MDEFQPSSLSRSLLIAISIDQAGVADAGSKGVEKVKRPNPTAFCLNGNRPLELGPSCWSTWGTSTPPPPPTPNSMVQEGCTLSSTILGSTLYYQILFCRDWLQICLAVQANRIVVLFLCPVSTLDAV